MPLLIRRNVTAWGPTALTSLALLATSCVGQDDNVSAPKAGSSASATPHGYIEGAQEAAEQQSRLLLNDPATGATRALDLITGKVHEMSPIADASGLTTDGRFGYLHTAGGTRILDGGAWTVDHGDHVHYYRAAIRDVGRVPGDAGARVRGDAAVTAVTGEDNRAAIYHRAELEKGEVGNPRALPGTYEGAVMPYAEHLLALTDEDGSTKVVVHDREGKRLASPDAECEAPRGDAVTRRGVVLGCADGALLISENDGGFAAEKIPYGAEVPAEERASHFRHRAGSDTLTALAADRAVWVLDVLERTWTRVKTGPVVAVNTAGEGSPLLVLQDDGALHGYDITTGKEVSETKRLLTDVPEARTDGAAGPAIEVDRSRAYLNDPAGSRVYEIDYNDNLRVARTFDLDMKPALMVETGR
ncbi:hypothetical protein [Streptomyces sp. NBC_01320]|uniref:hypothetical protein n=1 Tax=Streptomyces sp. NBC_01320 TaxID=2903824 RepID=UPI002E15AC36|nr:hypothetical protein OG395_47400 [Streptomyces sp. NBC_01320]